MCVSISFLGPLCDLASFTWLQYERDLSDGRVFHKEELSCELLVEMGYAKFKPPSLSTYDGLHHAWDENTLSLARHIGKSAYGLRPWETRVVAKSKKSHFKLQELKSLTAFLYEHYGEGERAKAYNMTFPISRYLYCPELACSNMAIASCGRHSIWNGERGTKSEILSLESKTWEQALWASRGRSKVTLLRPSRFLSEDHYVRQYAHS